jgi:hypothetical protein
MIALRVVGALEKKRQLWVDFPLRKEVPILRIKSGLEIVIKIQRLSGKGTNILKSNIRPY